MKTIFITGSTDGIGKLAAIKLAHENHQIIVHGRNAEKLKNVITEIKESSGNTNIKGYISDLSSFESIKIMIDELLKHETKIDVLINNAGVFKSNIQTNGDGLDLRFTVNYLAPYILTNGIMSLLKKSNAPRVINLSSAAQSPVILEALAGNTSISTQESYAQSKLAITMWSTYLAEKYDFLNVIAVNPGSLLNTRMVKEAYGHHWSPAEKGAEILYNLAILDKFEDCSGKYFDNDKGSFSNAQNDAYNRGKINQLMIETNRILNK